MGKKSDLNQEITSLKKLKIELQDWFSENIPMILDHFNEFAVSTKTEDLNDDYSEKLYESYENLKKEIKNIIQKEEKEVIPYIYHHIIVELINYLIETKTFKSIVLNEIIEICISTSKELKSEDPSTYSSLEPYKQFLPETLEFICNKMSRNNDLVEIVDDTYWIENIFNVIPMREENLDFKHAIRALILYTNSIRNRKKRLLLLKK